MTNIAVYRLDPDSEHFHNFAPAADSTPVGIYRRFDGNPLADRWTPIEITAVDEDDELAILGDHALLGTIPLFSERAVSSLERSLKENGELLPLVYARQRYFAYNVTTVVNALDEERSQVVRFSTGRVMAVDKFVFKSDIVHDLTIFKIPELRRAYVFVTETFVDAVHASGLRGFNFVEVWNSNAMV